MRFGFRRITDKDFAVAWLQEYGKDTMAMSRKSKPSSRLSSIRRLVSRMISLMRR